MPVEDIRHLPSLLLGALARLAAVPARFRKGGVGFGRWLADYVVTLKSAKWSDGRRCRPGRCGFKAAAKPIITRNHGPVSWINFPWIQLFSYFH